MDKSSTAKTVYLSAVDRDTHVKLVSVDMESFDVSKEAIALMPNAVDILNRAPTWDDSINRRFKMPFKATVLKKIIEYCDKKLEKRPSSSTALRVWQEEYCTMEQDEMFEVLDAALKLEMNDLQILLAKASSAVKLFSEPDNNEVVIVTKAVAATLMPNCVKAIRDGTIYINVPIKTSIIHKILEYIEKHNENHSKDELKEWDEEFCRSMDNTMFLAVQDAATEMQTKGLKNLMTRAKEMRRRFF